MIEIGRGEMRSLSDGAEVSAAAKFDHSRLGSAGRRGDGTGKETESVGRRILTLRLNLFGNHRTAHQVKGSGAARGRETDNLPLEICSFADIPTLLLVSPAARLPPATKTEGNTGMQTWTLRFAICFPNSRGEQT